MKFLRSVLGFTSCSAVANVVEITLKRVFFLWLLWAAIWFTATEAEVHWHFF